MRKSIIRLLSILALVSLLFCYCKKGSVSPPVAMHYEYFPSNIGHWIVYDVDSINYDDFTGSIDTFHFQIKEYIESTFTDNQNRPTQRIERSRRDNDTSVWIIKDIWYSNLTTTTAEKIEENVRFIKLVFPIAEEKKWNGNAYNVYDKQDYKYKNVHIPYTINNMTFDSTLTIIQRDEEYLTEVNYSEEMYTKYTGMIYKKYVHLEKEYYNNVWVIKRGVDVTYQINSFGN